MLSAYYYKLFFVICNDALDRSGTRLVSIPGRGDQANDDQFRIWGINYQQRSAFIFYHAIRKNIVMIR